MTIDQIERIAIAFVVALTTAVSAMAEETEWPQFRGNHRNGVAPGDPRIDPWSDGGPPVLWRQGIGTGYSSIAVHGYRIYTGFAEGEQEYLGAYEAATGREIWRAPIGDYFEEEFGDGPRSTPTLDGDRIYILGSLGRLTAVMAEDGSELWAVDFMDAFGAPRPRRGFATSVLVDGDVVIARTGGGEGKAFAAFDKVSGETRWVGLDGGPAPSSPLAIEIAGQRQYVFVGDRVRGVSTSGEALWSYDWGSGAIAMPIFVAPDGLFLSASYDVGSALIRIVAGESGPEVEEVWRNKVLKNHFNTSVLHEGHVYGFDNAILKCVSVETGEQRWAKRGFGKGSLILAGDQLVVLSDGGKLALVKASPERYSEAASYQALRGKSWTSPSFAAGRLYLRNQTEMISIELGPGELTP